MLRCRNRILSIKEFTKHSFQRLFWSLYGRFVWDSRNTPKTVAQVRQIVEIVESRRVMDNEWVLDAGCGTGDYSLALAESGFHVVGVDYAEGMLARAQAKVLNELANAVLFQQADLNKPLDFPDGRFDHLINISVLQVADEPAFTLKEFWRVLKPGGTLVLLHVPRPDSHQLPLREAIQYRTQGLKQGMLGKGVLIALKTWAERTGNTRYWTAAELQVILQANQFEILSVNQGPPIVILARKDQALQNAV